MELNNKKISSNLRFTVRIVLLVPALIKLFLQNLDFIFIGHLTQILHHRSNFCNWKVNQIVVRNVA